MSLHIRFAEPEDAPTLLAFIRALAEYEREPDAVEVTEETLAAQLAAERPPFECLLAERAEGAEGAGTGGAPVGFALFFHNYSTWRGRPGLYLEDLFVPPEHRGRGVGTALLRALAGLAVERGCPRFEWSVLDWNRPAIEFYESLGAVPMGEWTVYRLDGDALARFADGAPPPARAAR